MDVVLEHLWSLGGHYTSGCQSMISYFHDEIKSIARAVLHDQQIEPECILINIARKCHQQAIKSDGSLRSVSYIHLNEAALGWPYDEDYESGQYYEHEYRLEVDENYAAGFRHEYERMAEREAEQRRKDGKDWIDLWTRIIWNSSVPTLFDPLHFKSDDSFDFHLDNIPRYLFRAFRPESSGRSNDDTVASPVSVNKTPGSKIDLLFMSNAAATSMLFRHLKWLSFDPENPDSLMSWTTSLLFAIQYALWMWNRADCTPASLNKIKICVVDTTKFPRGQFVQDLRLIQAFYDSSVDLEGVRRFFDFRIN